MGERPHCPLSLQVKLASWSKEKPGGWYSTFRRGKKVGPFLGVQLGWAGKPVEPGCWGAGMPGW